ncbi:MAG: hypothetical protein E7294_03455 [Lachnospiraceae bacterium]|jgi:thiamine kinase-like enzyme|nr:hypothetical protein [Lachnospiraceae bacterium]
MKKIVVVYDDSVQPNKEIRTITGNKSYGDTIFKRVTLRNRMKEVILRDKNVLKVLYYNRPADRDALFESLYAVRQEVAILHLYSSYALRSTEEFAVLLTKAAYTTRTYQVPCDKQPAMMMFESVSSYLEQFEEVLLRECKADEIESKAFMDLSVRSNFLTFITGGFDARFFNALEGDEYTVTKKSSKKEKIRAEYTFYHLLPEDMKMWFVQPYDYKEEEDYASYTMERFHMTDIAIRFVHGAVSTAELSDILEKLFYFLRHRATKEVTKEEAKQVADELYVSKLKDRMEDLKKLPEYVQFNHMIAMGTKYESLEDVTQKYLSVYDKLSRERMSSEKGEHVLAIGHGDLCFSNILYNHEAGILKLIDPKGALEKEELYTDPYYDLAKLSHSICGCYDFFNSGLYQISVDRMMHCNLSIDTNPAPYIAVFKEYLKKYEYDYRLVRLYEASLFLSMLPYHMDQPGKVFGFILNAMRILEEVEACTKI